MRLATTTADFRGFCDTPAQMVRAYEGTGFRHLDYSFYKSNYPGSPFMGEDWMREVVDAAKEAERLGIDFVQAHSPSNTVFGDDPEITIKGNIRSIEACAYLGIDRLVVHSGRDKKFRGEEEKEAYFKAVAAFYRALYPAMEKYNVRVLAENYTPAGDETSSLYSAEDLLRLLEVCDHPLMGVCWDVGHANMIAPGRQYADITSLGEKLCAVHIQDNYGSGDNHICPFIGTLDIDAVMRGLLDNGFIGRNGVFTLETDNFFSYRAGNKQAGVLAVPTLELKKTAVRLMYESGKTILGAYGLEAD